MYYRELQTYLLGLCGGKCNRISRVGKQIVWKYLPHSGISSWTMPLGYLMVPLSLFK